MKPISIIFQSENSFFFYFSLCVFFLLQPTNSFEVEEFNCTFDAGYYNESSGKCELKAVDGRNKYINGHGDLVKSIDDLNVSVCLYASIAFICQAYLTKCSNSLWSFSYNWATWLIRISFRAWLTKNFYFIWANIFCFFFHYLRRLL